MKKSLGQLSRRVHKNGESFELIKPELISLFDTIDPISKDAQKCLDMIANLVVGDMELAKRVLDFAIDNQLVTEQIFTGAIRAYCLKDQTDLAIHLVRSMIEMEVHPHVRSFIPIFSLKLGVEQFQEILGYLRLTGLTPTAELFALMLGGLVDSNLLPDLIEWSAQSCNHVPVVPQDKSVLFEGTETKINDRGICLGCNELIKTIDLTPTQRELMLGAVFDPDGPEPSISRWLKTRSYDVVIDGANVAHYNNSPFDLRKVINMINKISSNWDKKILLVFAACRKKQTKKLPKWKNVDVFYTKVNTNDDLSWLYAGLYFPDIWVITNDQMRDHVYYRFTEVVGRDVIDLWMERNIVGFGFDIQKVKGKVNVRMGLDLPLGWSVRPQISMGVSPVSRITHHAGYNQEDSLLFARTNHVHIPLHDDVWLCGSL